MINQIYVEREIKDHDRVSYILRRFSSQRPLYIDHYGELFNRKNQNFRLQKSYPNLILAKKKRGYVLEAPKDFGIGDTYNFYFSHMFNCLYDCDYCFLQGMYSSADFVLFVNYEDFEDGIREKTAQLKGQKATFFSGYDCDSLAFDGVTGFIKYFLPIFKQNKNAILELRTKSNQINKLLKHEPIDNCIVAFSFTPENISKLIEHKVPSVKNRIKAMKQLANIGWKIGLRFDPIIPACNFAKIYDKLFQNIASNIPEESIHSISFGMMRFPKKMFKKMTKENSNKRLFSQPFENRNGIFSYNKKLENKVENIILKKLKKYMKKAPIYNCQV